MKASKYIRRRTWEVLEVGEEGDDLSRVIDVLILGLVFGNVVAAALESMESVSLAYQDLFVGFERVSIAAFSAEFVFRIWSSADSNKYPGSSTKNRLRYLFSPLAIVDILAIAPFYLSSIIHLDLRFLRVLRLLRLVKLTRYSGALNRVFEVYRLQRSALAASFILLSIAIVLSASLLYIIENPAQPEAFASIPAAMWWAVCTLTTVGYGDVTPITPLGKAVTSGITIIGIAMVALPTSLFASGFAHIMTRNEQALEDEALEALADGVFSNEEADAYARLAEQLYIEPDIAQEIIESAQRKQNIVDSDGCPHCGKSLSA